MGPNLSVEFRGDVTVVLSDVIDKISEEDFK